MTTTACQPDGQIVTEAVRNYIHSFKLFHSKARKSVILAACLKLRVCTGLNFVHGMFSEFCQQKWCKD